MRFVVALVLVFVACSAAPVAVDAGVMDAGSSTLDAGVTVDAGTLDAGQPLGTEYFVAPTGDDSQAGSASAPFRTIQHGVDVASAQAGPATVTVRGGVFTEKVRIASGSQPLLVRSAPGQTAVLDGTGLTVANGQQGLIDIEGRGHLTVRGFELRNFRSTTAAVPLGIFVTGGGTDLVLEDNVIHDIVTTVGSCSGNGGNAFGLAVYGDTATPWTQVVVRRNELHHLTLGCSESLSINGNVDGFEVSGNSVHDNDNIGIVAIGFEGTGPSSATDRARNGVFRGNTVVNITSATNPAYGGETAADGLYVDGAMNLLIEQNVVQGCDLGVEVASEHSGRSSSYVMVRSNAVSGSAQAGLSVGGYANNVGNADHVVFLNNATSDDTVELQLQFHVTETVLQDNVLHSPTGDFLAGATTGLTQVSNLQRNGAAANTFLDAALHPVSALDAQVVDQGVAFTCPPTWTCPAVWGAVLEGSEDLAGQPRVQGAAVDLGPYER